MPGLLDDPMDPSQYTLSDAERRKQMIAYLLLGIGANVSGARKGQEFTGIAQGAARGTAMGQEAISQLQSEKLRGLQTQGAMYDLAGKKQAYKDQADERAGLIDFYKNQGMGPPPNTPPPLFGAQGPPTEGAQMGPPGDLANSLPYNPAPSQSGSPVGGKMAKYNQYMQISEVMAQRGNAAGAQKYSDIAQKFLPEVKDTKTLMGPNGQPMTINIYKDGTTEVVPYAPAEKLEFKDTGTGFQGLDPYTGQPRGPATPKQIENKYLDTGGGLVPVNPFTNQATGSTFGKSQTPDSRAATAASYAHLNETKRHNQVQEGDPAEIESTAQAIAAGKQAPLANMAQSTPRGMAIMGRVQQLNPDYNAQDYGTQVKAMKDFATGKNGNTVRSLNVAIDHLDTLSGLADAMHNGNLQAVNKVGNYIATQTGGAAPTNFAAAKKLVADEIVKAIVGSGGGVADRQEAAHAIDAANSPAQLQGVIQTYQKLMSGQLGGLRQQYEQSSGRKDFDRFLSEGAKKKLGGGQSSVRSQADAILSGGN